MNKIVSNFGLLVFFISIIFFTQRGLELEDILLRSFIIFIVVTLMLGILVLAFIKAINKASVQKAKSYNADNLIGSQNNE